MATRGRKPRVPIETLIELRKEGLTIQAVADKVSLGPSTVSERLQRYETKSGARTRPGPLICSKCRKSCSPVHINVEIDPAAPMICDLCRVTKCGIVTQQATPPDTSVCADDNKKRASLDRRGG